MSGQPKDLKTGSIHSSNNYGDFSIISYKNSYCVKIKFLDTGFERNAESGDIRKGKVKDPLFPICHGIGFIGIGKYASYIKSKSTPEYACWKSMMRRCYSEKELKNNPTYEDCSVYSDWHNFQNFADWYRKNYIEGYQLDKDIKINGNKVYSADSCLFVTGQQNAEKAHSKNYKFISPNGDAVDVYNLRKFCNERGLTDSGMNRVITGEYSNHKGWTKA